MIWEGERRGGRRERRESGEARRRMRRGEEVSEG